MQGIFFLLFSLRKNIIFYKKNAKCLPFLYNIRGEYCNTNWNKIPGSFLKISGTIFFNVDSNFEDSRPGIPYPEQHFCASSVKRLLEISTISHEFLFFENFC